MDPLLDPAWDPMRPRRADRWFDQWQHPPPAMTRTSALRAFFKAALNSFMEPHIHPKGGTTEE